MSDKDIIVCRCEEVSLHQLIETTQAYNCSFRELKLRTRAGMGVCGGRTCRNAITSVVCKINNLLPEDEPLKYQLPIRTVSFGFLEGGKK